MDSVFFKMLSDDLNEYRPQTTTEEKMILMKKTLILFTSHNPQITYTDKFKISDISELFINITKDKLFMYRKLTEDSILPHVIPPEFEIFEETCGNIYENFISTIDNLSGNSFNLNDILKCENIIKRKKHILSWSNTSILLNKTLSNLSIDEQKLLYINTFGSPILVPEYSTAYCMNIYHEDDWILELFDSLYKINTKNIERNYINECIIDGKKCCFVILSRDHFKNINDCAPHRCFNLFL